MVTEDRESQEGMKESSDEREPDSPSTPDDGVLDELFLSPDDSDIEDVPFEADVSDGVAPDEALDVAQPAADTVSATVADELRERLSEVEAERDEIKNRLMRSAADLENFRRRTAREKEDMRKYGIDKVVLELLPVLDNLDRALDHAEKSSDQTSIVDGVRMVQRQFGSALEKHGVKGFDSKGDMFDPQRHEAIQQIETAEHETGTVMEEYQRGYFLHERLIRPAMVVVAKKTEAAPEEVIEMETEVPAVSVHEEETAAEASPDAPDSDESDLN